MSGKHGKPKAIFFDAGGTLFCPFPSVGDIYASTASRFGTSCDPQVLEQGFHSAWQRRGGLASLGSETSEAKERAWWYSLVREVFDGAEAMPDFDRFFEALYGSFEEKSSWEIYPDVWETLSLLRERGFIVGIVSNWDLRLPRLVRNLGLLDQFDFVLGSSHCGATKPHPEIFQEALRRARVRPQEAIHVGDSYEEDFLGAQPLGITAYLLDRDGGNNALIPDDFRITSLAELSERIEIIS